MLAIDKEAKALPNGKNQIGEKYPRLIRDRSIFDEALQRCQLEVAGKIEPLNVIFVSQLEDLQETLTKDGRIEEAILIKSLIANTSNGLPVDLPEEDLIGHWTFDKNGKDSSGEGRDAALVGGAEIVAGKVGKGALKTGPGHYAEVAHDRDLNFLKTYTVSTWCYLDEGVGQDLWAPIATKANMSWRLILGPNFRQPAFHINTEDGRLVVDTQSDAIEPGKWIHLAATFDGKSIIFYLNGHEVDRHVHDSQPDVKTHDLPLRFGGNATMPHQTSRGMIDDVRIYRKPLEPSDIQRLAGG